MPFLTGDDDNSSSAFPRFLPQICRWVLEIKSDDDNNNDEDFYSTLSPAMAGAQRVQKKMVSNYQHSKSRRSNTRECGPDLAFVVRGTL